MSCGYSEERLAMWLDSSEAVFPLAEIREMNQHLASCATCRATIAKLRESQELAGTLRVDPVNPAVLNRVHQQVMDQVAVLRRAPSWMIQVERCLFSGMRRKYVLVGVGSLVLACGAALGLMWFIDRRAEITVQIPPVQFPLIAAVSVEEPDFPPTDYTLAPPKPRVASPRAPQVSTRPVTSVKQAEVLLSPDETSAMRRILSGPPIHWMEVGTIDIEPGNLPETPVTPIPIFDPFRTDPSSAAATLRGNNQ
jgi:hypothetical protein